MCQSNRIWLENGCDLFYGVNNVKRATRTRPNLEKTQKKTGKNPEVWDPNPIKKINCGPIPTWNFQIPIGYPEVGIRLGRARVRESIYITKTFTQLLGNLLDFISYTVWVIDIASICNRSMTQIMCHNHMYLMRLQDNLIGIPYW